MSEQGIRMKERNKAYLYSTAGVQNKTKQKIHAFALELKFELEL